MDGVDRFNLLVRQRANIETALQNGNDAKPMPSEVNPIGTDMPGLNIVAADKFGRLWRWDEPTKTLLMIFDPREARS